MSILDTTAASLLDDVSGETAVLVDFWAPWCGPCRALAPHLDRLAKDYEGRLKILKLNIDSEPDGGKKFGVRAIPTLIFYANGKEHDRLTGPSTIRMRMTMEKWFAQCGLETPESAASEAGNNEPEAAAVDAPAVEWCSFDGDEAHKDRCISRYHELSDAQRGSERVQEPSTRLAGDRGRFEEVVGVPRQFGDLVDSIWMFQSRVEAGAEEADATALRIFHAIPVGVNLARATTDVLHELVYHSRWEITQYFTAETERDIVLRIKAAHAREHAGEKIAAEEWETLQRAAVMLSVSGGSADLEASQMLEGLAGPMSNWSANGKLHMILKYVNRELRRKADWSDDEEQKITAMIERATDQVHREIGSAPRDDAAARAAWVSAFIERRGAFIQQCREQDPDLWKRYDVVSMDSARQAAIVGADVAESLLTWLSANAPRSV
ncbi:thioredoxin domain-containing protein [Burkholderia contaminans]|uniref:thioredoxin family protein n=1 Tax=Burkholderia contaminans TaxID=488447 RepID=UPI003112899B